MSTTTRAKKRAAARKVTIPAPTGKATREARLSWVPIEKMRVADGVTQRIKLNRSRVDHIATNFDLEQLGTPTVNRDDEVGCFWIIDGWHRVEALKAIGWGDQQVQCWTYEGLTQDEMAERFLKLSDTLAIDAMTKFRVAITAGRPDECDIDRIVRAQGFAVSRESVPGAIRAVGALRKVYARGDNTLARTLIIVRDAFGDAGTDASVIDGIGHLCNRYNGELEMTTAIKKLSGMRGGVSGLLNRAEQLRRQTGNQKSICVAAAAVETINAGRGGKKLPPWWKGQES